MLTNINSTSTNNLKKTIQKIDKDRKLETCSLKAPLIARVVTTGGSWPKLCDSTLHFGSKHREDLQNLSRIMVHHARGSKPYPLCDDAPTLPLIKHVLTQHHSHVGLSCISEPPLSTDKLLNRFVDCDICFVYQLWPVFDNFLLTIIFHCHYLFCSVYPFQFRSKSRPSRFLFFGATGHVIRIFQDMNVTSHEYLSG